MTLPRFKWTDDGESLALVLPHWASDESLASQLGDAIDAFRDYLFQQESRSSLNAVRDYFHALDTDEAYAEHPPIQHVSLTFDMDALADGGGTRITIDLDDVPVRYGEASAADRYLIEALDTTVNDPEVLQRLQRVLGGIALTRENLSVYYVQCLGERYLQKQSERLANALDNDLPQPSSGSPRPRM